MITRTYPDPARAALVARGEVGGCIETAAAELAVVVDRQAAELAELSGELSDVLGEVRALFEHPDGGRRLTARARLRARLGSDR